jgi:hypothetical protein
VKTQHSSPGAPVERVRIDGWKDISSWFKADVKTVQRWEKFRSLPVHRLPGGRGRVFAWSDELSAWMEGAAAADTTQVGAPVLRGPGRRTWLLGAGAVAALAVSTAALRRFLRGRVPDIHNVAFSGGGIQALGLDGSPLWTFRIPYPLRPLSVDRAEYAARIWHPPGAQDPVVLAIPSPAHIRESPDEVIYCLSASGNLLWQCSANPGLLDFDGKPFEPGWGFEHMIVTEHPAPTVWLAATHGLRWASCVLKVSLDGKSQVHFANFGHCQRLAASDDQKTIYIGGVNNAMDRMCLALTHTGDPPTAAPREGPPRYAYPNGPTDKVRKYIIFPSTEFNIHLALRHYSHVDRVSSRGDVVTLLTKETDERHAGILFEFDAALDPRVARPGASCRLAHQRMETAKLVQHPWEQCALATGPLTLRYWENHRGWYQQAIPVATPENRVNWGGRNA